MMTNILLLSSLLLVSSSSHCLSWFSMLLAVTSASETTSSPSHLTTTRRRFHSGPGESSCCLVVGSANADTFLPVARLPSEGENLTLLPGTEPFVDVPGGKGCTQAVAVSKLLSSSSSLSPSTTTKFVGQVGDDHAGKILLQALDGAGVDCTDCGIHPNLSSGRGYVFLTQSGSVSAVVSGGSNVDGWTGWEEAWNIRRKQRQGNGSNDDDRRATTATFSQAVEEQLDQLLDGVKCILLQREVPEYVNLLVATCAKERDNTIIICQDVGGEDRPISSEMLQLCDFVIPNESELIRLVESSSSLGPVDTSHCTNDDERVVEYARALQKIGATNVLVTRGSKGSTLLTQDGQIIHQSAIRVPPGRSVVDETGAGDCYRAAFAVALLEGHSWKQCMVFASAAGSCSVEVNGAVPSTPSRDRVMDRLAEEMVFEIPRGDGQARPDEEEGGHAAGEKPMAFVRKPASSNSNSNNNNVPRGGHGGGNDDEDDFPFLFGSRLNSMKDRPDLWEGKPLDNPREYVKRQATVRGLTAVDFNYPQHFGSFWSNQEARAALDEAGLAAGAVCLRYPSKFARGAMNHPSPIMRREAVDLTKQAAEAALELGTNEVVIWSAFDGYDYPFQVDYDQKWDELVIAFRELCDEYPSIKFSLEYKPTDENTRFFTVPTTGAALLFVEEVNRPNMGLTLDVGHMLMAGENPGQSVAMVGRRGKLFGIQLNDGFTRLAAEDGLMFGSVHPSMALEIMYQMKRTNFQGHFYFDTFPQRSDPVKEAEYNIRQAKRFWYAACSIDESRMKQITDEHDAIAALELVNDVLSSSTKKSSEL